MGNLPDSLIGWDGLQLCSGIDTEVVYLVKILGKVAKVQLIGSFHLYEIHCKLKHQLLFSPIVTEVFILVSFPLTNGVHRPQSWVLL